MQINVELDPLNELISWAIATAETRPLNEQVKVFSVLAELMPVPSERAAAREVAESLSRSIAERYNLLTDTQLKDRKGDGE